jgi:hypothetical protein
MAETAITVQTAKTPFEVVSAGGLDFTLAAADASNGNKYQVTGREILVMYNSDASPQTVTINSVNDEKNRDGDIAAYSLAAGDYALFAGGLTNSKGWKQTDGTITLTVSDAGILLAAIRLP